MIQENETSSTAVAGNTSNVIGGAPRKFSKYNPNLSVKSTRQVYKHYNDGRYNAARRPPPNYLYTKNIEIQHVDVRPSIAQGNRLDIMLHKLTK